MEYSPVRPRAFDALRSIQACPCMYTGCTASCGLDVVELRALSLLDLGTSSQRAVSCLHAVLAGPCRLPDSGCKHQLHAGPTAGHIQCLLILYDLLHRHHSGELTCGVLDGSWMPNCSSQGNLSVCSIEWGSAALCACCSLEALFVYALCSILTWSRTASQLDG